MCVGDRRSPACPVEPSPQSSGCEGSSSPGSLGELLYYYHIDNVRFLSHSGEPTSPEAFLSGARGRSPGAVLADDLCAWLTSAGPSPPPEHISVLTGKLFHSTVIESIDSGFFSFFFLWETSLKLGLFLNMSRKTAGDALQVFLILPVDLDRFENGRKEEENSVLKILDELSGQTSW